jgi:hypothetical protein
MIRVRGVYSAMVSRGDVTSKLRVKVISIALLLLLVVLLISVLPLFGPFENYFINGLTYDSAMRLFVGQVDKKTHYAALKGYYGRMKNSDLSWRMINKMVDGMFSQDYDYTIITETRRKVTFYGNDAVCLFKYFVKNTDPQRHFVWAIVGLDLLCFCIIAACYVVIGVITSKSSRAINRNLTDSSDRVYSKKDKRNNETTKRLRKTNRKIAIIIGTNFICWVPFIFICAFHSFDVLDATPWYSIFSIVILPINSMINPFLYDDIISKRFEIPKVLKNIQVSCTTKMNELLRLRRSEVSHASANLEMAEVDPADVIKAEIENENTN